MSDYLTRACRKLGVDESQVMTHRIYDNEIVLIVDYGVKGGKKYTIPLEELPDDRPADVDPSGDPGDVDLSTLTVVELQEMAKDRDIAISGLRKADLVAALEA